jgi:hypothetical protein
MKNLTIGILLIASLVFGGLYFRQGQQLTKAQSSAAGLQQKIDELQFNVQKQQERTERLGEQLEKARTDADVKIHRAAQEKASLQRSLTNQAQLAVGNASGKNLKASNPFAEMFKNPEMKEMIKNQQKTALSAMIDKNYGKFFSSLNLTPEQTSSLKDMILNKQLGAADMAMSLMSEDIDATKRTELTGQIKAASEAGDAQIKALLGDDNFAQFQSYEKSMNERMAVAGFKEQLASSSTALTDDQEQQLIQAMTEEREKFKFTTDFSDKSKFTGDFGSMFTEDKMNGFVQELGQLNQQYLERAQSVLSADQIPAFDKYLKNQAAMQKAGLQMAVKMFAPK